jgi:hypothetical protein
MEAEIERSIFPENRKTIRDTRGKRLNSVKIFFAEINKSYYTKINPRR